MTEPKPRSCFNPLGDPKIAYASKKEAKTALKRYGGGINGRKFKKNGHPYRCPVCNQFHIGYSQPRNTHASTD